MKLILFRHLWGVTDPWEQAFPQFAAAGYQGIESRMPDAGDRQRFESLLKQHRFQYIPQIFTEGRSVAEHVASFRKQLIEAASFAPRLVNAHSGQDAFTGDQSESFFEAALRIEDEVGVPVAHETHRGRILFNPWTTAHLIDRFDSLKLCCDFSHWVCVCERLINDQLPILRKAAGRCAHLHARVGYEQGPQVPDPRAPEFEPHLSAHEKWWRIVWQTQRRAGHRQSTLTPEFGPPHYLHTLPFTGAPVANLAEVCDWQAARQAAHFARCMKPPKKANKKAN